MSKRPVKFADAPIGLFVFRGELCVKTGYYTHGRPDAYIVGSGEYFLGGCSRSEEVAKLMVIPVAESDIDKLAKYSLYAKARIAELEAALRDLMEEAKSACTCRQKLEGVPTEPGWYWMESCETFAVEVSEHVRTGELIFWLPSEETTGLSASPVDQVQCTWYGPICQPGGE